MWHVGMGDTFSSCRLCGATPVVRFHEVVDPQTREAFQIFACPACGHGCTRPVPAVMNPYYGAQYYGGRHGWTADYCVRRRLRYVTTMAGPGNNRRLLDVGCGDGAFLRMAKEHGWQVSGTERNPDIARAAGLDVHRSLDEVAVRAPFDCITVWHVLEHFTDPLAELESIRKLLKPEGVLILAVPNAEGTQARLWGRKWFHLDVPRHLHHFGERSLKLHLAKTGFTVAHVWHGEFEYDLLGWSQSALNCLLPEPNVFFGLLTGRRTATGRTKRMAHLLLGALSCGLALLPTWWGMLAGRAGTLILAARPRG